MWSVDVSINYDEEHLTLIPTEVVRVNDVPVTAGRLMVACFP